MKKEIKKLFPYLLTTVICIGFIYNLLNNHLKYETRTLVSKLTLQNMPDVQWFLCAKKEVLYNGSIQPVELKNVYLDMTNTYEFNQIITSIKVNGLEIDRHGDSFLRGDYKCWQIFEIPSIGDISVSLYLSANIYGGFTISRNIEGNNF